MISSTSWSNESWGVRLESKSSLNLYSLHISDLTAFRFSAHTKNPNHHLWRSHQWSLWLSLRTHMLRSVCNSHKVLENHWQHVNTLHRSSQQRHLLSRPANKQLGRPLQTRQLMQQQLLHHKPTTQCSPSPRERTCNHTHRRLDRLWCN